MNTSWATALRWVLHTDVWDCHFHLRGSLILKPKRPKTQMPAIAYHLQTGQDAYVL